MFNRKNQNAYNNPFDSQQKKPKKKKWIVWIIAIVLLALIIGGGKKNDKTAPTDAARTESVATSSSDTDVVTDTIDVDITVKPNQNQDTGRVSFDVTTNLPEGAELMFTLSNSSGYRGQLTSLVQKGGKLTTDEFSDDGEPLVGRYDLVVSMGVPSTQSEDVRKIIGEKGEFLTGDYVVKSDIGESNHVSAEFNFEFDYDYEPNPNSNSNSNADSANDDQSDDNKEKEDIETAIALIKIGMGEGFSKDNFEVYYDEENDLIVVNTWQDNIAAGVMMAALGDEASIEAWNNLKTSMSSLSSSLSGLVSEAGVNPSKVMVNVLNDTNKENVLLTVVNGAILIDAAA